MRVLLVSHRFPPGDGGGVERYTQSLAEELVRAGDTVSIVMRRPASSVPEPRTVRERLPDGTALYRFVGGRRIDFNLFLAHDRRLEQLFTTALVEAAPDVVHFNHLLGLSPRFITIAHRLRVPVVVSLHDFFFACPRVHLQKEKTGELCPGPQCGRECARTCFDGVGGDPADPVLRWGLRALYYRRLLGLAHRLISGSRYVASYFERFAPGVAPIRVIPNGVPVEDLVARADSPVVPREEGGTLNLAYCGTVVPHKGIQVILDALRVADAGPVDLLVIGRVPREPGIPEYVQRLCDQAAEIPGLTFRVHGDFQRPEFPSLLADRDFVIVPSLVPEAGPQVPREALAQGVPVLASRLGALPETVTEGENGWTFDPRRPEELAEILQRARGEEGFLSRLRDGARRTPVVTVADHAAAVRAVYQESMDAALHGGAAAAVDLAEANFLHEALVGVGFANTKAEVDEAGLAAGPR